MNKFTQNWAKAAESFTDVLNTVTTLANNSLENAQKITALQCKVASSFIEQSANTTKDLLKAKTPAQASTLLSDFAAFSVETTLEKSQEILNLLNKSQASLKEVANSSFKNASDTLLSSIDKVADINPAWSKAATASVQKMIEVANQANETFEKVAEQVSSITTKNVTSATEATVNTLRKTKNASQK